MSSEARNDGFDQELDLMQLLQSIWASRLWIGIFTAASLFIGAFYLANTPPTYEADALLQLEERSGQLALPAALSGFMENDPRTVTEIEIISSRLILGQVVAALNLDWVAQPVEAPLVGKALTRYNLPFPHTGYFARYGRKGDSIALDLLEVPPGWVDQNMILTVTGEAGEFSLELPDGSSVEGKSGTLVRDAVKGYALNVGSLIAPPGRQFVIRQINELAAVNNVRQKLSIAETGKQSGILRAKVQDKNRMLAVAILNGITQAYVRQNIDRSAAEAESSLAFIQDQLPKAKAAQEAAEKALNDYRLKQQSVDLTFETENALSQVTRIETDLRALQVQEDDIKQRYKTSHPVYQQLLAQRERLQEELATVRKQVEGLPETQREVLNLTSNLELTRQIYTELQTRAQEVQVLRASTVGNVRIVDSAQPSLFPVAPRRSVILALSLIVGFALGTGFGLLRIWLRKTVQGTEILEKMGLPVFATINLAKMSNESRRTHGHNAILALTDPTDLSVEGIRSLRTSLQFGMIDAKSRSLAITSTAPGAGKSFTSTNLAVVSSQAGQRVCLVDADLRRGQLRKQFGIHKNEIGLSEYLADEVTLDEVLRETTVEGLTILSTGRYPPNPSELLMRDKFKELVAELDRRFDLTIFDCPPVLAVTDPVVVGRATGGLLAVVRYDETPIAEVSAMLRTFDTVGLRLTGVIMNGFDPRKARAGGYSYNYNYRYEYKSRDAD